MSNHNNSSNSNGSGGGGGGGGGGDSGDSCCISPRPVDFGTRLCKKEGGSSGGEPGLLSEMESAAKEVFGKAARTNDLQALDRIADDMVKTVREGAREAFAKSPASQASASRAFILCLIDFIVKMFHLQSPNHETRAAAEKVIRDLSSIQKSSPADSASSLPPSPKPSFELPQDVVSLLSTLSQPAQQQQQQQQQHQHSSSPPPPPPAQLKPKTAVKIQTVQKKSLPRPGGRSASMSAGTLTSSGRKTAPAPPPRMTVMATSPQSSLAHQPTKKQPPQTPPPVKKQLPQPPPPMQQTVATTTTTTATATAAGGGATATVATPLSSPNACTLRSKSVKVQGKPLPGVPRPLSERKAKSATKDDLFVGQHSADYDCIAQCLTLKLQQQQQQQQQHTSLKGFDDGGNSGKKAVRSDTPNESADDENESGSATPNSSSEPVAKDEKTKKKTALTLTSKTTTVSLPSTGTKYNEIRRRSFAV